jgi:hypothetical protein
LKKRVRESERDILERERECVDKGGFRESEKEHVEERKEERERERVEKRE